MNIRHYIVAVAFLFSVSLISQEVAQVDQDYLNSLPDEVKNDILKEISNSKNSEENKILKAPSSDISSLETVKRWEKFLKNEGIEKSERFGMQIFRSMQSTFMPINEPNLTSDYILDYGDVLEIQIIGSNAKILSEKIQRDGSVSLPQVGKIYVGGQTISDAIQIINNKVTAALLGSNVFVTLTNIRDIQVLITGFSKFPGLYTVSGNTNILNVLNVSGGISEDGSFRKIDIKRNGKIIKTIDLYQALIFGNIDFRESLRSGDAIYIHPAQKLIRAGNGFKNQGIFELTDNETYKDFLNYSGGLSRNVTSSSISINSISGGIYKNYQVGINDIDSVKPKNNDSLYAIMEFYGTVKLSGEVMKPGNYEISSNETISSIIKRAGGYKENAYPFGGILLREEAKNKEKYNNERLYNEFIKYIASTVSKGSGSQIGNALPTILNELKNIKVLGRVQAEFDILKLQEDTISDIFLSDKDEIHIPKFQPVVYVFGEVNNPGGIKYVKNNSAKDYIKKAGDFGKFSNKNIVIIIDPSGSAEVYTNRNFDFTSSSKIDVYPGSLIYVSRDINKREGLDITAATSQIFSSLALSLASLNAIN